MALPDDRHPYAHDGSREPALRCPRCQGPLERIRRRFGDRVLSLLVPVRRYRCDAFGCRWEGLLRQRRDAAAAETMPVRRRR